MGKFGASFDLANLTVDRKIKKPPKLKFSGGHNVSAIVPTPETPN